MTTDTILVTDDTSREELTQALASLSHRAQREMPKVGTELAPTPWDRRHVSINSLLDELDAKT